VALGAFAGAEWLERRAERPARRMKIAA